MLKFALIILVFATVCSNISHAYDNQEYDSVASQNQQPPERKEEGNYDEKHYKKYHKGLDEKYDKQNSYYKHKKYYGDEKKRYGNDLQDSPKSGKYSKYEKRQYDYEYPGKSKEVSHHDKTGSYEKKHTKETYRNSQQEIIEDPVSPVSLHHDIDINYINHPKTLASDAEIINKEDYKKRNKKENFQLENDIQKRSKTNFYKNLKEIDLVALPKGNNSALNARYILHNVGRYRKL